MTLVDGYVKQYDGHMHISNKNGTTVQVELSLE